MAWGPTGGAERDGAAAPMAWGPTGGEERDGAAAPMAWGSTGGAERDGAAAPMAWGSTGGAERNGAAVPRFVGEAGTAAEDESWFSMERKDLEIDQCDKTLFTSFGLGRFKGAQPFVALARGLRALT
jgi:hypothetical protein